MSKIQKLSAAIDTYMFQCDVYPNVYNSLSVDTASGTAFVSPKGLLLVSDKINELEDLESALGHIMSTCDISNNDDFAENCYSNLFFARLANYGFNPYELELLDVAYFGDFIVGSSFITLMDKYETHTVESSTTVSIYEEISTMLFSDGWFLDEYDINNRMMLVLELAERYLRDKGNGKLDYNWILKYIPKHYTSVAEDIALMYDD